MSEIGPYNAERRWHRRAIYIVIGGVAAIGGCEAYMGEVEQIFDDAPGLVSVAVEQAANPYASTTTTHPVSEVLAPTPAAVTETSLDGVVK